MKKLKLNFQNFSQVETLSRTHMRNVLGGNSLATGESTTGKVCTEKEECDDGQDCKIVDYDPKFRHCE